MSSTLQRATRFGSYQSRRAEAYVKGKSGYDEGFLPPRSSPTRFPKSAPTADLTAPQPKTTKITNGHTSIYSKWKYEESDRRRRYMSEHIKHEAEERPKKFAQDRERMMRQKTIRDNLLNAPESRAELLSLPSIERTIADEYPLLDNNKNARANKRLQNRRKNESIKNEIVLHQFLNIHHNSAGYVTTLKGLDTLLESTIGSANYLDVVPKHTLTDLAMQAGHGAFSYGKVNQVEADIDDQIMGTAAGGRPGVMEVSQILSTKTSSLQS
ncbi:protein of unknown function [Taphrina deformans PYCC 5710]|uniref:Uncharacterized protein n=1 Tax=Taphrina deformans (strain PYCC 5710 / ATCC 11124 / CBS 356.35 / IMI 108563 / JCM 9778 / NBRC 8474) TaxID=1097556 RepID=R4XBX5_TAPDE|nr:protein of unknown function [Taphrina deformans PYCC 5710]|eukprot:CCG81881.1 protein of unknown function [Taphrina deformans PYCC 5710]